MKARDVPEWATRFSVWLIVTCLWLTVLSITIAAGTGAALLVFEVFGE